MRTKDWKALATAKVLIIGEDSNLQWSGKVPEYVMFADYYFRSFPEDHGERSRNVEARNLFTHVMGLTAGKVKPSEVYVTNLCNDDVDQSPKGKRVYIPEAKAQKGLDHIEWILSEYPTIEYVFVMSMQSNYWLQKFGFYVCDADYLTQAEPRRAGSQSLIPYYQPVNGKAFSLICGNMYAAANYPVKVVPILPARDFPLSDKSMETFGEPYNRIRRFFKELAD